MAYPLKKQAMKVLLTGGAGFIGYHLTKRLLERGDEVVAIDNLDPYYDVQLKKDRLARLEHENYSFHKFSILETDKLNNIVKNGQFDSIVHLAALAGVRHSLDHGIDYVRTNYEGTFNIFEAARHNGAIKVVYASSSSVYGGTDVRPSHEELKVDKPLALYGATKKATEEMAYVYHSLFQVPSVGLRFFTVYGPWGRPDMALFLFTDGILNNRTINVFNYGKQHRDFTYISDIVEGIIGSIDLDTQYEIVNLGSGQEVPLLDFIHAIEDAVGKKADMNLMEAQPGDVAESLSDISKAEKLFGYKPKVFYKEGIKEFVDWYRTYYGT